jgi:hypothetical protein
LFYVDGRCDECAALGRVQWVVKGALDVDSLIGANPSIEGGEDEGADDQATKVVDIVNKCFYPHYNCF